MDHRAHNKITKLKDSQGREIVSHKDMESVVVQNFLSIAEEPMEDRSRFINHFTQYIPQLVTREDNHNLNRLASEEDVSEVINEMQNGKAPGPDGFNVDFFKACWKKLKKDILEVVEDSRRSKKVLKAFNASFIALIPKQEKSNTVDGFRPIALCNVVYKIISKVITNRLKPLLLALISEEKMGYVEGRQILNNIIQSHEVVHSLKRNKQAGMIIQLDLTKAYDKRSWSHIRVVLRAYGFNQNWIRWVMALVTTTSFSNLLNGARSRLFTPSRGLEKGDLLSPFLFVLMMEGLGRAIKMANTEGRIQGTKLTLDGAINTHQQFVDDTTLRAYP